MSDNIVEVTIPSSYSVSVETSLDHNPAITITLGDNNHSVNVINNTTVLVSDLPQGYPLSWTVEDLPASRVSGLPVTDILGGYGVDIQTEGGNFTVSATGLQPSGNYSVEGHSHYAIDILDFATAASGSSPVQSVSGRQGHILLNKNDVNLNNVDNTSDLNKPISYAVQSGLNLKSDIGHQHVVSSITDFNSGVSGLLPSIRGSGYVLTNLQNNDYIISITGLQPSGNYSTDTHTHGNISNSGTIGSTAGLLVVTTSGGLLTTAYGVSSNLIKDFQTSVSGLLPSTIVYTTGNQIIQGYKTFTDGSGNLRLSNIFDNNTYLSFRYGDPSEQLSEFISTNIKFNPFNRSEHVVAYRELGLYNFLNYFDENYTVSSDNFKSLINDSTGSGQLVFHNSPNFSGIPTAPTASSGNNSTQIANTAFVRNEISSLVNSAPSTLDTLNELATALGNDPNFATTVSNTLGTKANLTGANFTGSISGPSGDFSVLKQNGVIVSVSGHSHISNDITNFNSSVSGLLPVTNVVGGTNINVVSSGTTYTINVSGQLGLTAEQVDDRVAGLLVAGTGISLNYDDPNNTLTVSTSGLAFTSGANFNSLSVTGVPVSVSGHKHSYTDITNWASGIEKEVTTLLIGGNYINLNYDNTADTLTISASGLQPSGNYANSVHSHGNITSSGTIGNASGLLVTTEANGVLTTSSGITSSYITNFNSSVSGLLPSVRGSGYINSSFNNNIYTISTTGLQPSGNYSVVGHTHTSSDITNFNSSVSGLLPTISNSLNNRLLTSTGTSVGINAESNLTFNGSILDVSGQIDIDDITLNANIVSTNTTNTDLILKPNGDGSLIADTSGNARGIYSNDFQRERTSPSGVAAGSYSVIGGGSDNRASNLYSVVCGGQTNTAGNSLATIGGGDLNTANGNRSTICGGGSNIASGASSNISGGSSNQSTGPYSIVPGGFRAKATRHGELSHSAGFFVNPGDAQHTVLIARRNTTDATADVVLTLNGLSPVSTNILNVPAQTMWTFSIKISAYNNTNSEGAWWIIRGGIRRNNSNVTALVGSLITESGADSSLSTATAEVVADDTNEALEIRVTGVAGKAIRWVAVIDISQVSFGVI